MPTRRDVVVHVPVAVAAGGDGSAQDSDHQGHVEVDEDGMEVGDATDSIAPSDSEV